jgi:hypothetical protein
MTKLIAVETCITHAVDEAVRYVAGELVTFFQNVKLGCPAFLLE